MAEAILRRILDKRGRRGIIVESAGLSANGMPAAENAILAVREWDGEAAAYLSEHRSRTVTPAMMNTADIIAVMTTSHAEALGNPPGIVILAGGIPDPYGGGIEDYRRTLSLMGPALEEIANGIA